LEKAGKNWKKSEKIREKKDRGNSLIYKIFKVKFLLNLYTILYILYIL
jgi:hypothetical protein